MLTVALLLAWLAAGGCKSEARRMSEYPYFIRTLDARWQVAREGFRTGNPNVSIVAVLLKDLAGAGDSLRLSYDGPNKDRAIAELTQVARQFQEDLAAQVDMRFGSVVLLPGVKPQDVGRSVEKAYQGYARFRELVKL